MDAPRKAALKRRLLRAVAVLGGLFVVYTAFGFLAAPPILRRVLVDKASAALHREVEIEKVRLNPLALSVTVSGLRVTNRDGSPFVAFASLYLRVAPLRILSGEVGLAEIRLVRPSLHLGLLADGALSFQDLLESGGEAAPPPKKGGLGFAIGRLSVEEAQVAFHDATRRPAFEALLGPLTIHLESFSTKGGGESPYSFSGRTDRDESFRWTGTVRTGPLRSSGSLTFERVALPRYGPYLSDAAPVDLRSGLLDLDTRYELEWGPSRHILRLEGGKVTVSDLSLSPRGVSDAPLKVPHLEVSGIEVDAVARQAKVVEVSLREGAVRVRRQKDGSLELMRMAPPPAPRPASPAGPPFRWAVGTVAVGLSSLTFEDQVPEREVTLALKDLSLKLEHLNPDPGASSPLALSFAWPNGGKVTVEGSLQPFGGKGAVEVVATELDLVPLEPYLGPDLLAHLASGRAGAKVKASFDAAGDEPRFALQGDLRLDGLSLVEGGNPDLLRWRALELNGVEVTSAPPRATVRQVRLLEPRAKVYLWENGETSLARAFRAQKGAADAPARPAPKKEEAPRTAIGTFEMAGGRASFVDRSVKPPAVLNVTGAQARVTNLSSDPGVRSTVDVRLDVEGVSPVRVSGTVNPLQNGAYTDLTVESKGVDLSPLGPYAGRYLGYGIQKGKLDLDLRYQIENRNLVAKNVVRVNQFTLGEATHSADATKLPVRLALALLQDRDGVILLDVPVEGKLDDPEFRLGKVIWRAVLNVLVKVVTSPFSALAALVGGGTQEISLLEFTPGTSDPLPSARERLSVLAKSLAPRPALGLEVEGSADEAVDGPALRKAAFERSLRHAKAAAMTPPPTSEEEVTLSPEERAALVRAAYAARSKAQASPAAPGGEGSAAAAPGPAPEPSPEAMEESLVDAAVVAPDAYASLAAARAESARDALVAAGIDQGRLFLTEGSERARKERGARVYFSVK